MDPKTLRRLVLIGGGIILVVVGVPMLILPGPGILSILAGAAMVWKGVTGRDLIRRRRPGRDLSGVSEGTR